MLAPIWSPSLKHVVWVWQRIKSTASLKEIFSWWSRLVGAYTGSLEARKKQAETRSWSGVFSCCACWIEAADCCSNSNSAWTHCSSCRVAKIHESLAVWSCVCLWMNSPLNSVPFTSCFDPTFSKIYWRQHLLNCFVLWVTDASVLAGVFC